MHLLESLSLSFAVPITFLLLFVPCIGFLFPNASHSRLLLSLSKHCRIINLPIFTIFSFPTAPLIFLSFFLFICRSSDQHLLTVPFFKSSQARRSFLFAAPTIWNSLPLALRTSSSITSFHSALKTRLFPP